MKLVVPVIIALLAALSSGCDSRDEEPEGVIPEGHKAALDKASAVEEVLEDSHQKRLQEAD